MAKAGKAPSGHGGTMKMGGVGKHMMPQQAKAMGMPKQTGPKMMPMPKMGGKGGGRKGH